MYIGRYFVLADGTTVYRRPSPLESYTAYVVLCARPGYQLQHKSTKVVLYSVTILEAYEDQWEAVRANPNQ